MDQSPTQTAEFSDTPVVQEVSGPEVEFTGTLTHNAEVRNKAPRDGLHTVPVLCMDLKNTLPDGPRYCHVERAYTDATRRKAEALASEYKRGKCITVKYQPSHLRLSVSQPVSIYLNEAPDA